MLTSRTALVAWYSTGSDSARAGSYKFVQARYAVVQSVCSSTLTSFFPPIKDRQTLKKFKYVSIIVEIITSIGYIRSSTKKPTKIITAASRTLYSRIHAKVVHVDWVLLICFSSLWQTFASLAKIVLDRVRLSGRKTKSSLETPPGARMTSDSSSRQLSSITTGHWRHRLKTLSPRLTRASKNFPIWARFSSRLLQTSMPSDRMRLSTWVRYSWFIGETCKQIFSLPLSSSKCSPPQLFLTFHQLTSVPPWKVSLSFLRTNFIKF